MYGQIHVVLRELVEEKYGHQTWMKILRDCQFNEKDNFMTFQAYPDSVTLTLVKAIADVLELSVDEVLKMFGDHFLTYCMKHGFDKMLTTLGMDLVSFIENLDSLHSLLSFIYGDITSPSFRCVEHEDGSLTLHYYSVRQGLAPLVIGIMEAVGKQLFQQSVTLTVLTQTVDDIGLETKLYHTEFSVEVKNPKTGELDSQPLLIHRRSRYFSRPTFDEHSRNPGVTSIIRSEDFNSAFPYHILLDRFLFIQECGNHIQKLAKVPVVPGTPFREVATILSPAIHPTAHNVFNFINSNFLVALHTDLGQKHLVLKGQMMWLPHCFHLLFIGSPRLTTLDDFKNMKIYMSDVPIYDVTRELLLLKQHRITEIDVARKLDEASMELKKVSKDVEEEERRSEELLYQMMPHKVAAQLIAGNVVPAEKYESCTMLFSDILTFTEITEKCPAERIVSMLNDIYHRFDTHTDAHDVYKVETIGDAYMAVTGVPEIQEDHAERMADFAMDILDEACYVMSPATGKPLKIRVGMHSGGVVAGVIGKNRPRYDIYGDTVTTASLMESYSAGGRIHISHSTFNLLYPYHYQFRARGEIVVKGKGLMKTYFLLGHSRRPMLEPADPFTDLPKVVNPQPRSPRDRTRKTPITVPAYDVTSPLLPHSTPLHGDDCSSSSHTPGKIPPHPPGPGPSDANASALVYPPSGAPLSHPPSPVQHLWPTARVQCRLHHAGTRTGDSVCGGSGDETRNESRVPGQVGMGHCATRRDPLSRSRVDTHPAGSCPLPAGVSRQGHGGTGRGEDRLESVLANCLPGHAEDWDAMSSSFRDSEVRALWDRTRGLRAGSHMDRGLDIHTTENQLSGHQSGRGVSLTINTTEHSLFRHQLNRGKSLTINSAGNLLSRHQLDRGERLDINSTGNLLSRHQLDWTVAQSQDASSVQLDTARSSPDDAPTTRTARQPLSPHHCSAERQVDRDDNLPGMWELHDRVPCVLQPQNCCLAQTMRADRDIGRVTRQAGPGRASKDVAQHWCSPIPSTPLSLQPPPQSCLQHLPPSSLLPSPPAPTHRQCAGQFSEDRRCLRQVSLDRAAADTGQSLESCPCSLQ